MSVSFHRRARTVVAGVAGPALALALAAPAVGAPTVPDPSGTTQYTAGRYVIVFKGDPTATYSGGVSGIPATKAKAGQRLNAKTSAAQQYAKHLTGQQNTVLGSVGAKASLSYTTVLNGAAANLTARQAQQLAKNPQVLSLAKDTLQHPTADTGSGATTTMPADMMHVSALWKSLGGRANAGAGAVIGVIDTGIWPESESFKPNNTPIPSGFTGACQTGQDFSEGDCNGKIVGARYYIDGYGEENISDQEYLSPRDGDGHGSHTASTAAGDIVKHASVDNTDFGTISGMAPGAKIAAYKVCWTGNPEKSADGCANSDILAAINDAVNDGVNVINFSIGGTTESPVTNAEEITFLNAAAAGVFISASAGNSGPGSSTLDHPSPWLTTVAASTYAVHEQVLQLGDGRRFVGASTTDPLPSQTPMVLASAAPAAGATAKDAGLCIEDALDPAKVRGKLVVCLRGTNARVEKSWAVKKAGGVGMVQINPTVNSLNGDLHFVPSVHLPNTALAPVTDYVSKSANPTGAIVPVKKGESKTRAPEVAEFSSRGPSTTTGGDILKPDLSAPGVDVLAAVTPSNHHGRNYDMLSGTSMAAPHVAGLALLLHQAHAGWSPMAIKSALMTTARDHATDSNPFDQGAGFVRPNLATDPGLVLDAGTRDWLGYLNGLDALGDAYPQIPALTGPQLNQASLASGAVAGSLHVQRTLTSVSNRTERYKFSAQVPGFTITSTPSAFTIKPGQSQTVNIMIRRSTAPVNQYATGYLMYSSSAGNPPLNGDVPPKNGHNVRMPVALRATVLAASTSMVQGSGATGSAKVTLTPGMNGTLTNTVAGLTGITPEQATIQQGTFDYTAPEEGPGVTVRTFTVPAGTAALRFDTTVANKDNDLDLYVYRVVDGKLQLVALSAAGGGDEQVIMNKPAAGTYQVYVNGYTVTDAGAYTFRGWVVPEESASNLTVAPATAPAKSSVAQTSTLSWSGLDTSKAWFGVVRYSISGTTGKPIYVTVAN